MFKEGPDRCSQDRDERLKPEAKPSLMAGGDKPAFLVCKLPGAGTMVWRKQVVSDPGGHPSLGFMEIGSQTPLNQGGGGLSEITTSHSLPELCNAQGCPITPRGKTLRYLRHGYGPHLLPVRNTPLTLTLATDMRSVMWSSW